MHEMILFYNGLGIPTRHILDSRGAIPSKTVLIQREIKKVNEKVYVAQVGCKKCKGTHYTKDCPLKEEGKPLEEAYYTQFGGPFQGEGYRAVASGFYQRNNANPSYQERRKSMEDTLSKFMSELAKRHEENSNMLKENRTSIDASIQNQGASIKTIEIQIEKMSKVLQEGGFRSLPRSTEANLRDQVKSILTTIELIHARYVVLDPPNTSSLDPLNGDYIELNDLNKPFELRRNQGDDLMPTIKEGEVIEKFRTRDDKLDTGIDDYPSYCDYDKKIHIDYAHNLKFSYMIGFEFTHANFFPLLYVNVMSKRFYNSIIKDKMVYKGNNVIRALMNVPIFVGTFFVVTYFVVLENMDAYRNEGMGDVIFGEPFLREVGNKTRRFERMITIYNGNDEVSDEDKKNGISHPYQKLEGFYKGVLNLGPDYIQDAKTEEWLTPGYISVYEMEW
nr:hypothetical protein [Tanacetum cinerariifolium]